MCVGSLGVIERIWDEGGVPMAAVGDTAVCLFYTPGASVGDTVLVHIGYAVEIIEAQRAAQARALREEIGEFVHQKWERQQDEGAG